MPSRYPLGAPEPPKTACLGDSSLSQLKGMCFGIKQTGFKSQLLHFRLCDLGLVPCLLSSVSSSLH